MEIELKDNVFLNIFKKEKELKEIILKFIVEDKTRKILYKGNPEEVNYKLLKKILPIDKIMHNESEKSINKFVEIKSDMNVREIYFKLLENFEGEYCIIYKK